VVWGIQSEFTLRIVNELSRVRLRALNNSKDWDRAILATNQEKLRIQTHVRLDRTSSLASVPRSEQEINGEEYYFTREVTESLMAFGEDAEETVRAKFNLARYYADEDRYADAAALAEAVWRFRIMAWVIKGEELPISPFFSEPFFICLQGYIAKGAAISHLLQEYPHVLHHAIHIKYHPLIGLLLQKDAGEWLSIQSSMVSVVDDNGYSPLHKAMFYPHDMLQGLIDQLLSRGADVTYRTSWGVLPLHLAVARRAKGVIRALLDHGADPDERSLSTNSTALHYATATGDIELVEQLLDVKADVGARTFEGVTALHLAVLMGYRKIVKTLLSHGANVNAQTQLGAGPIHIVILSDLFRTLLKDPGIYVSLRQSYVDSGRLGEHRFGDWVMRLPVEQEDLVLEWRHGRQLHNPSSNVAEMSHTESDIILQDLLDSKAYIDLRCIGLSTPLHLAIALYTDAPLMTDQGTIFKIINKLLQNGADVMARDVSGHIPETIVYSIINEEESGSENEAKNKDGSEAGDAVPPPYDLAVLDETCVGSVSANETDTNSLEAGKKPNDHLDESQGDEIVIESDNLTATDQETQNKIASQSRNIAEPNVSQEPPQDQSANETSSSSPKSAIIDLGMSNFDDLYDTSD
jgi:ankyrin repeat protein